MLCGPSTVLVALIIGPKRVSDAVLNVEQVQKNHHLLIQVNRKVVTHCL